MQGLRLGIPDPVDDFLEARRKSVQLLVRFRAHWGTWAVRVHAVLDVQVRVGAWRMTKEEAGGGGGGGGGSRRSGKEAGKGRKRKTEEGQARAGLIHANTRSPAPGGF